MASPTRLVAWLYPGTRLYSATLGSCVVLVFPRDPLDYARIVLGEYRLLDYTACCPLAAHPYLLVEALLEDWVVEPDGRIRLNLRPRHVLECDLPRPFSRLDSCMVEVLIAYTRIVFHEECSRRVREYESIARCLDLLERRARGEHRRLYEEIRDRIEAELEHCRDYRLEGTRSRDRPSV